MSVEAHGELRDAVRAFLQSRSTSGAVRALMATPVGYDRAVWHQMAAELGLHGIAVPEEFGGAGATMAELAVVLEEMGSALLCSPFFATIALAAPAVITSGDRAAMAQLLPGFADGSMTATVIFNGELDPWSASGVTLAACREHDSYRIDGEAAMVLDGLTADVIMPVARTDAGISLFSARGDAAGLRREPLNSLDRTRKIARVRFDGVTASLIGDDGRAESGLQRTSDLAVVALSAEQVGGAQRCLDMAVGYAKDRIQFGRPIGSFQAVKHRCADMLVSLEGARSAVVRAAELAGTNTDDELSTAASVAKLAASEAFLHAALDNMRIHGGIGFTWEHDAHLYVRRAKAGQLMFGSPDLHVARLAELVGAPRQRDQQPAHA